MTTTITHTCSFCGKTISGSEKNSIKIEYTPVNGGFFDGKTEYLELCNEHHEEFLRIFNRKKGESVCNICQFAYCCTEEKNDECMDIKEIPQKTSVITMIKRLLKK